MMLAVDKVWNKESVIAVAAADTFLTPKFLKELEKSCLEWN
jgi:hypothetical protein